MNSSTPIASYSFSLAITSSGVPNIRFRDSISGSYSARLPSWSKGMAFGKPFSTSPRFLNRTWEHLFHFTKGGDVPIDRLAIGVPYADKGNIERFDRDADLRCRGNVWLLPYETINDSAKQRGRHPATFAAGPELEALGFFFCGAHPGTDGSDRIFLQRYSGPPIDFEFIKLASDEALEILSHIKKQLQELL